WDVGMNPVKNPIRKRKINSWWTEVANPISKRQIPSPEAEMIKINLRPYLSPNLPQTGANNNAVTKVIPKIQPDQFCTYESEKSPNSSMYKEMNGNIIVM